MTGAGVAGTGRRSCSMASNAASSSGELWIGERTHSRDTRRLLVAGVSKFRNSLDDMLGLLGVKEGTRVPLRFASAFGSIDLRRLCPPRGISDVSTA